LLDLSDDTLACRIMRSTSTQGYRFALRQPGVRVFTVAGLLGRLPVAMNALAIVLLVSNQTGSYAYAGILSALLAVTTALLSIVSSRIADRIGQVGVLRVLAIAHSASLALFTISVLSEMPRLVQVLLVIVAGATTPAIGSYVRARWTYVSVNPSMVRVGFAWESILDEAVFTVGPIITTAIAFSFGFGAPLFLAAALVLLGGLWLAAARTSTPPPHASSGEHTSMWAVVRTPGLIPLIGAAIGLGTVFGTVDVGVVAFTAERDTGSFAGVILATFAGTSLVGGIIYGARPWPGPLHWHPRIAALALLAVTVALPFATSNAYVVVVIAFAGFSVSPALIGIFTLTSRLVSRRHLTEGLTWTNSGLAAGFALGSSLAGVIIDSISTRAGFVLTVGGAALAVVALSSRSLASDPSASDPSASDPSASDGSPEAEPAVAWNDDPLPGPHPMSS
jgi:hypothetical protein